jgi:predicted O-linked N-acetylglucosamine transferase (SPINDLY family)
MRLLSLKERLTMQRESAALFDTTLYTRTLEQAYIAMIDRHRSGLPPADIEIK